MTIVHLIPGLYPGGSEKVMEVIAKDQLHCGHRVVIIAFEETSYTSHFEIPEVRHCSVHYRLSLLGKSDVRIDEYEKLINELQPAVIHSHAYWTDLISHHFLRSSVVYISHFHLYYEELDSFKDVSFFGKRAITRWIDKRRLMRSYKAKNCFFICASNSLLAFYQRNLPQSIARRIRVISNPVANEFFAIKRKEIAFELLTVGRLVEIKNHEFLLKVLAHLQAVGVKVKLAIVGDGHLMEDLKVKSVAMGVADQVYFLGIRKEKELVDVFASALVYVHASSDETFGLSLFEAVAAGLPVVALEFESLRANMPPSANVSLVKNKSVETFSQAVLKLLQMPLSDHIQNGERARQLVANFSESNFCHTMRVFYDGIASGGNANNFQHDSQKVSLGK
jgi:glycosyltransferase involved in cell wall biosynthesis